MIKYFSALAAVVLILSTQLPLAGEETIDAAEAIEQILTQLDNEPCGSLQFSMEEEWFYPKGALNPGLERFTNEDLPAADTTLEHSSSWAIDFLAHQARSLLLHPRVHVANEDGPSIERGWVESRIKGDDYLRYTPQKLNYGMESLAQAELFRIRGPRSFWAFHSTFDVDAYLPVYWQSGRIKPLVVTHVFRGVPDKDFWEVTNSDVFRRAGEFGPASVDVDSDGDLFIQWASPDNVRSATLTLRLHGPRWLPVKYVWSQEPSQKIILYKWASKNAKWLPTEWTATHFQDNLLQRRVRYTPNDVRISKGSIAGEMFDPLPDNLLGSENKKLFIANDAGEFVTPVSRETLQSLDSP